MYSDTKNVMETVKKFSFCVFPCIMTVQKVQQHLNVLLYNLTVNDKTLG